MTQFRSLTDAQLAAKHDPTPYVTEFGDRSAVSREMVRGFVRSNRLDPRVECVPSRDPMPFIGLRGVSGWATQTRYSDRWVAEQEGDSCEWAPRPEYARSPVNPILSAYRDNPSAVLAVIIMGEAEESDLDQYGDDTVDRALEWEPIELWDDYYDHARKVLSKLAAVYT